METTKTKNVIELNGKHYNSLTGELLDKPATDADQPAASHVSNAKKTVAAKLSAGKSVSRRTTARHLRHHAAERSHTLMRRSVHKPAQQIHSVHAGSTPVDPRHSHDSGAPVPMRIAEHVRLSRTQTITKSTMIQKFGDAKPTVIKKTAHLPVQAPPLYLKSADTSQPAATAKAADSFQTLLDQALVHHQPARHGARSYRGHNHRLNKSRKMMSLAGGSLAILLLAGFIITHNVPGMAMRTAAARAGFAASLPGYRPSGFTMNGPIQYAPGLVSVSFKSNSDNRAFQVNQRPTTLSNQSLPSAYAALQQSYQRIQAADKTVYLYGKSGATWVKNGVWYDITGSSSLSSDQLLSIANSM